MTTAGSGDVLTGMVAALLVQGLAPLIMRLSTPSISIALQGKGTTRVFSLV
ncbi:MAG: hypothetical protein WB791_10040 [Waddliaceae bacterium]